MALVTQAAFSRRLGISREAVRKRTVTAGGRFADGGSAVFHGADPVTRVLSQTARTPILPPLTAGREHRCR